MRTREETTLEPRFLFVVAWNNMITVPRKISLRLIVSARQQIACHVSSTG